MYVCVCNGVTEAAIRRAVRAGIRSFDQLQIETGCAAGCGCCRDEAQSSLAQASSEQHELLPTPLMVARGDVRA